MHDDLARLDAELAAALTGLTAAQTQVTPPTHPEKWSIQQIVEHLLLSYGATATVIQTRIDKRSPTRTAPSLIQRVGQFSLISLGLFPFGRKAPTAVSPSLPATLRTGNELAQRVHASLVDLDQITAKGEEHFSDRRAATHIVLGPLSMRQWRRFHLVHGRHHLKQIQAIRRQHSY